MGRPHGVRVNLLDRRVFIWAAMKFTLGGKTWTLKRPARIRLGGKDCDGRCDFHIRTILIHKSLTGIQELWTILHELRHASDERLAEDFVDSDSQETSDLLWRLGYRRLSKTQRNTLGIE